jgi:predicted ATP-dependent endonuclease of OLD family
MFGSFNTSNFSGSNILVIGPEHSGKSSFISKIKDEDSVVLDDAYSLSKNDCLEFIKKAKYRQIIVSLKDSNTQNKCLVHYDYIVIFNNSNLEWRNDIYQNFSLLNAFDDFNEFSQALDKLNPYDCLVMSVNEGTIRRTNKYLISSND